MLADCSASTTGPHSWEAKNEEGVGQEEDLEDNGGWRRSAGGGVGGGSRAKEEEQETATDDRRMIQQIYRYCVKRKFKEDLMP